MLPRVTLRAPLLVLLLCGLLAATLVSAPTRASGEESPAPRAAGGPFALDLAGQWRFKVGDDPDWSDPGFDDSSWEQVKVPQEGGQPYFANNDGYAWFRLEFNLPANAKGTPLVASLGGIDDADQTFLNGVKIGSTGSMPPNEDSQWFEQRLYPVPAQAPNYGGRNVLAVRMNDFTGGGGWYRGPVGLFSKAALRSFARSWTVNARELGFRVNVLSPGAVRTPGLLGIVPEDQQNGFAEAMAGMIPRGELGDADDVAAAALLLASGDSKHVNGAEWFIDGGYTSV